MSDTTVVKSAFTIAIDDAGRYQVLNNGEPVDSFGGEPVDSFDTELDAVHFIFRVNLEENGEPHNAPEITDDTATPKTPTGTHTSRVVAGCKEIAGFASAVRASAERTLNVAIRTGSAKLTNESVSAIMSLTKGVKIVGSAQALMSAAFAMEDKAFRLETSANKLATSALEGKDLALDKMPKKGKVGELRYLHSKTLGMIELHGFQFTPLKKLMPKTGIDVARGPLGSAALDIWLNQFIDTAKLPVGELIEVGQGNPAYTIDAKDSIVFLPCEGMEAIDDKDIVNGQSVRYVFSFDEDGLCTASVEKWETDKNGKRVTPKAKTGPRSL